MSERSGFTDEAYITVRSGNGGNGCVSFKAGKGVKHGKPDGGNGGKGGDIIFKCDTSIRTLLKFRFKKRFFARR